MRTIMISDRQEFIKAVINEYNANHQTSQSYILEFSNPVTFPAPTARKEILTKKKIKLSFFVCTEGTLCYSSAPGSKTGRRVVGNLPIEELVSLTNVTKTPEDKEQERLFRVSRCMAKFHPSVWSDIVAKYKSGNNDPIGSDCDYKLVDITKIFYPAQIETLKDAFENMKETSVSKYYYGRGPNGRDYSAKTKLDPETGIFRAWFSAEYPGTGNGYYYMLINPTTAVFVEKD